jgi:hypothetical protein
MNLIRKYGANTVMFTKNPTITGGALILKTAIMV